jgi:hypothetical protein
MRYWQVRIGFLVLVLFVLSTVFSIQELRYLAFGRTIDAKLGAIRQIEHRGRYGTTSYNLGVSYEYDDEVLAKNPRWASQAHRRDEDEIPTDWRPLPSGQTVRVQFIPGTESSRLEGHHQLVWVGVFGVFLAIGLGWCLWFWRFYKS